MKEKGGQKFLHGVADFRKAAWPASNLSALNEVELKEGCQLHRLIPDTQGKKEVYCGGSCCRRAKARSPKNRVLLGKDVGYDDGSGFTSLSGVDRHPRRDWEGGEPGLTWPQTKKKKPSKGSWLSKKQRRKSDEGTGLRLSNQ